MSWLVGLAWGIAVLVAVVVLGACGYELAWKSKRLSKDLRDLLTMRDELASLQQRLAAAQRRLPARPGK
ncbi:MAG TPA: hypothetical protein VGJ38_06920 [Jatrophihabitantaceae bacterium]